MTEKGDFQKIASKVYLKRQFGKLYLKTHCLKDFRTAVQKAALTSKLKRQAAVERTLNRTLTARNKGAGPTEVCYCVSCTLSKNPYN